MHIETNEKNNLENQFQELFERAKAQYPDIEEIISISDNITSQTNEYREYLNLIEQTPLETSSNQVL